MRRTTALFLLLLSAPALATPILWKFTFGPDSEVRPFELERGTLLLQFDSDNVYDATRHYITRFALNIDNHHYSDRDASGMVEEWLEGTSNGMNTELLLKNGSNFFIELATDQRNGELYHNNVYAYDGQRNLLLQGIVTSWRVLGIPEPDTLTLLLTGLLALSIIRKRRKTYEYA